KLLHKGTGVVKEKEIESAVHIPTTTSSQNVLYDVSSLFTNVPVDETIEILVDKAFHNEWFNKTYHLQLERSELANLLNLAVKNQLFQLDGKLYQQKLVDNNPSEDFLNTLNNCHPSLNFTMECEVDGKLPFLGMEAIRTHGHIETKVYVKPTNTGLLLHYQSHVDRRYKKSLITTMLNCAFRLSSSWKHFVEECDRLKSVFANLRYPLRLVDSIISEFVTKKYAEMNSTTPTEYVKRDVICVALPFKDQKSSDIVRRQLAGLGTVIGRALEPVFKSRKIKEVKVHKMKPPIVNQQRVVYRYKCDLCDADYVGYTSQHLHQRIDEHKRSVIGKHMREDHEEDASRIEGCFSILRKCQGNIETSFNKCNIAIICFKINALACRAGRNIIRIASKKILVGHCKEQQACRILNFLWIQIVFDFLISKALLKSKKIPQENKPSSISYWTEEEIRKVYLYLLNNLFLVLIEILIPGSYLSIISAITLELSDFCLKVVIHIQKYHVGLVIHINVIHQRCLYNVQDEYAQLSVILLSGDCGVTLYQGAPGSNFSKAPPSKIARATSRAPYMHKFSNFGERLYRILMGSPDYFAFTLIVNYQMILLIKMSTYDRMIEVVEGSVMFWNCHQWAYCSARFSNEGPAPIIPCKYIWNDVNMGLQISDMGYVWICTKYVSNPPYQKHDIVSDMGYVWICTKYQVIWDMLNHINPIVARLRFPVL
ncbi:Allatostatin-A receptor, partial [Paramuricea clavata]